MVNDSPKNEEHSLPQTAMAAVCTRFAESINALRLFAERVGPIADEQDKTTHRQQALRLLQLIGFPDPEQLGEGAVEITVKQMPGPPSRVERVSSELTEKIAGFLGTIRREAPKHGLMLGTSALMLAVSMLDALFGDLLRANYTRHPSALDGEEHTLTFKNLCQLGNVEVARDYVLHRKVESVLRRSMKDQLKFIRSKLHVDLTDLDPYVDILDETIQRRHVWVHNAGRASKLYLANVSEALLKQYAAVEGQVLPVDLKYLRRAIDRVNLAGVVISQQCWRKWIPEEVEQADDIISNSIFDTICDRRFSAAQYLAKYAIKVVSSSDACRRNVVLNYAQALKWAGKSHEAKKIIANYDWTSCSMRYRIAVFVLRDEIDEALKMLPLALSAQDLTVHHIEEWPIFQTFKLEGRVQELLAVARRDSPRASIPNDKE